MAVRAPGRFGFLRKIRRGVCARGPARALPSFSGAATERLAPRGLSLTSLIDVMVVLVVFMLLQFVAPDPCGCITRELELPFARQGLDMIDGPMVSVTSEMIFVDGRKVASRPDLDGPHVKRIEGMFTLLKAKRDLARALTPGKDPPTHVILAIDGSVPSRIVKSVTLTAAASGYANIDFMVVAD
jgi:biopolymer transport protein ExbD